MIRLIEARGNPITNRLANVIGDSPSPFSDHNLKKIHIITDISEASFWKTIISQCNIHKAWVFSTKHSKVNLK